MQVCIVWDISLDAKSYGSNKWYFFVVQQQNFESDAPYKNEYVFRDTYFVFHDFHMCMYPTIISRFAIHRATCITQQIYVRLQISFMASDWLVTVPHFKILVN